MSRVSAQYSARPEEAVIRVKNGTAYIVLCQNIVEKEEHVEGDAEARTVYECEENQIVCPVGVLDLNDVQANPGRYMDYEYVPGKEPTYGERLEAVEDGMAELAAMVAEVMG